MPEVLCRKPTDEGGVCLRHRTPGEDTCWWHDPDRVEAKARQLEEKAARLRAGVGQ